MTSSRRGRAGDDTADNHPERGYSLSARNALVGAVLSVGLVVGVVLVVAGSAGSGSRSDGEDPRSVDATDTTTRAPLPLPLPGSLTRAAVGEMSGLAIPENVTEFLTARLDDDRQLDVTFVMASSDANEFVSGSHLAEPEEGRRVVLHSSPLWKLNPDDGSDTSGTSDTTDGITRTVELIGQPDGSVRVRAVLRRTPG